jgi:surfeit locus 1 family protein
MRIGRYRFRPDLTLTLATLAIVSGCIRLGFWQLDRAAEKVRLADQIGARLAEPMLKLQDAPPRDADWRYRRVAVRGEFVAPQQIMIDNQILQGWPGYHVVAPFKIADSGACLLVNRGWTPLGRDRSVQPQVPTPASTVTIQGRLDFPTAKPYGLRIPEGTPWTWRWPYLDLPRFRSYSGLDCSAYVLFQESDSSDSLVRTWPVATDRGYRHNGYALQWFAFALIGIGVYLKLTLRPPADPGPRA